MKVFFSLFARKDGPVDFSKMFARVEKYVHIKEVYKVHGPPPSLVVKEWPPAQEFWSKKEDQARGR